MDPITQESTDYLARPTAEEHVNSAMTAAELRVKDGFKHSTKDAKKSVSVHSIRAKRQIMVIISKLWL